jgi:hypothetical protein
LKVCHVYTVPGYEDGHVFYAHIVASTGGGGTFVVLIALS